MSRILVWGSWSLLVSVGLVATGCTAVDTNRADFAQANSVPDSRATMTVEYRPSGGKPQAVKVPVGGEDFRVQQALDKSGAWKKFNRIDVALTRQTPQGRSTKMAVSHDKGKRRVEPQCDYQVLPGDTLVVTEDPTTVLDEMLNRVGPFGRRAGVK